MAPKLAIVTGAPGWLGSRLVECLLQGLPDVPSLSDAEPCIVRVARGPGNSDGSLQKFGEQVQVVDCDITDGASVDKLFAGTWEPVVFHVAGVVHPTKGRKQFYDVNVNGTANMLESAIKARTKRFVYVSSNSPNFDMKPRKPGEECIYDSYVNRNELGGNFYNGYVHKSNSRSRTLN